MRPLTSRGTPDPPGDAGRTGGRADALPTLSGAAGQQRRVRDRLRQWGGASVGLASVAPQQIKALFITHHHSDHNADMGNLVLLNWGTFGPRGPMDVYGPPPLATMAASFEDLSAYDLKVRAIDTGYRPGPLLRPHEIGVGGAVLQDANVQVTAAVVHRPPVEPSFAYRFDTAERSIVISGDTTYDEN